MSGDETKGEPRETADETENAESADTLVAEPADTLSGKEGEAPIADEHSVLPLVKRAVYDFGAEIARGGMGRIRHAHDKRMGRPVAIKELISKSPIAYARFQREARLTGRLQHPGIVPIYEAGIWEDGEPFFVMKRVDGRSFDSVIRGTRSLDDRLVLIPNVIAVADAIAYAHSRSVIHRDLKPANVLVGDFGETVVIDWGLGKDLSDPTMTDEPVGAGDSANLALSLDGAAMGTPSYMPPEQARGEPVDERADVYAIGAMLYHLLAGGVPYRDSKPSTAKELLEQVIREAPPPLLELEPEAPRDLVAVVEKAMARAPADRYATAGELAEELKRFETGQLVNAHEYSSTALVKRWVRRHRTAVDVAVAMILVLVVGGGLSFWRIASERDRAEEQKEIAEENRGEVEDLLDFMLIDLREKLQPIGKLDLLYMVAKKARRHYALRHVDLDCPKQGWRHSVALQNLGDVLSAQGDVDGALQEYRSALEIRERLAEHYPEDAKLQRGLALAHGRVACVCERRGDLDDTSEHFRAALAISRRLPEADPLHRDPRWLELLDQMQRN